MATPELRGDPKMKSGLVAVLRPALLLVSAVQVVFAVGFFFQWPFAIALWPFPGTTPLTYVFMSSIFAAAAASQFWAIGYGNYGALGGIFLDYVIILTPISILAFQLGSMGPQFTGFALICAGTALIALLLMVWAMRLPLPKGPPMPTPVRWSFIVFTGALVFTGSSLILGRPNVIPWTITPDVSVVIGWIFLGAAGYFVYGLLRPGWWNAGGQLAGFLAYDIVLIVPFVTRLSTVSPDHQVGLYIYTTVVTFSGLLAAYYLFINPTTRVWSPSQPAT